MTMGRRMAFAAPAILQKLPWSTRVACGWIIMKHHSHTAFPVDNLSYATPKRSSTRNADSPS